MKYLLDTNICIELIRKKPPRLIQKLMALEVGAVGISSITVAELQYGVSKSRRPEENQQALDQFLLPLAIVEFDYEAAVSYGRVRADLERAGTPIGALDTLIGAHAQSLGVVLVTNNLKEFTRIPQLRLEDWLSS